eukprot:IDg1150t1
MSASSSNTRSLSEAAALKRYSKLAKRTENLEQKDEHVTRFLLVAHTVLNQHSVDQSNANRKAILDNPEEVLSTITDLLAAPSKIFTPDYLSLQCTPPYST